jgi:RNA polymerase-binding transcription factor DksA
VTTPDKQFLVHQRKLLNDKLVTHWSLVAYVGGLADPSERPRTGDISDLAEQLTEDLDLAELDQLARSRISEIEAAIARIDEGSYGICRVCTQPIEPSRLEALPTASLCGRCKAVSTSSLLAARR